MHVRASLPLSQRKLHSNSNSNSRLRSKLSLLIMARLAKSRPSYSEISETRIPVSP